MSKQRTIVRKVLRKHEEDSSDLERLFGEYLDLSKAVKRAHPNNKDACITAVHRKAEEIKGVIGDDSFREIAVELLREVDKIAA